MFKIVKDLSRLPEFEVDSYKPDNYNYGYDKCRSFYIRWFKEDDWDYKVHFGQISTFDRWANSINFQCKIYYRNKTYRTDIVECHRWAEKICKSGFFDFNSYFATIEFPFLNPIKNKRNFTI